MGTQRARSGSKGQHVDFLDIGHVDIHHDVDIYPDVDIYSAVDILSTNQHEMQCKMVNRAVLRPAAAIKYRHHSLI